MKQWRAERFGKPTDVLEMQEIDAPSDPDQGNVVLQVDAVGIGLPDSLMLQGNYPAPKEPPITPGMEVSGTVVSVADDSRFQIGEKVVATTQFAMGYGGLADYCVAHENQVLRFPSALSREDAAGFRIPFHTAYEAFVNRAKVQKGEIVLILGGAGSSGSAAIQVANLLGANVIAVVGSKEKAEFCKEQGAHFCVNYRDGPVHESVAKVLGGNYMVDVIFDPVGGDTYQEAVQCIRRCGRYLLIGYAGGSWGEVNPRDVLLRSYTLMGVLASSKSYDEIAKDHEVLCAWANESIIQVPIDTVFEFEHAASAIDHVERGMMTGKVIVRVR